MYRVLLPIDVDEDRARATAESIISFPNAADSIEVTILNVQEKMDIVDGDGATVRSSEWYDEDSYPESALTAKSLLEEHGISVTLRRKHADPTQAILDVSKDIDADQIVMAGRKRTPVGKVLFGSVTQSVLLNADVPVTVVVT